MSEEKHHWKKSFNYDYIGAYSLEPGKDMVLTIKDMKKEEVIGGDGKKQMCFVAYFMEPSKPMILNRTNCKTIAKIYESPFIEDWVGKKIQLYAALVKAFGDETDALRIRTHIPLDHSELIKKIRSCNSKEEILTLYNANKNVWTGEVKQAAVETKAKFPA